MGLNWCGHSADVRLFASSLNFYQNRIACKFHVLNDYSGPLLEEFMYHLALPLKNDKRFILRFKREPHMGGMEGSNVKAISFSKKQNSLKGKLKRLIGNLIRIVFPNFWF